MISPPPNPAPQVGVVMGSDSDWPSMRHVVDMLENFQVPYEVDVLSAHRMPEQMLDYARQAAHRGLHVIVAGAGGAAHLPGMLASATVLPVIGVPIALAKLDGLDSLLSIVQMPAGVPVATVSIDGGRNAGLLALRILASGAKDHMLQQHLERYARELQHQAQSKGDVLRAQLDARSTENIHNR